MKKSMNILRNALVKIWLAISGRRNVKFSVKSKIGKNVRFNAEDSACINLGRCSLRDGCIITARNNAKIESGGVSLNYNCIIVAYEEILIGKGTIIGPNVCIYDHDHDFRVNGGIHAGSYRTEPVHIGENVWIGAGCIILKGTTIGNNCVIAAGSVVTGNVEPNSIYIQKKETTIFPIKAQN